MNVLCATCDTPLAPGEAMILHESHTTFHWFCEGHWKRWQRLGEMRLAEEHGGAAAWARRAAVIPREGTA